jgi:hypothetical protein
MTHNFRELRSMGIKKLLTLLSLAVLLWGLTGTVQAGTKYNIIIKTILASQGPRYVDARLSDLVKELESVFRYSSYRLLGQTSMSLGINETGLTPFPGDRVLKITPIRKTGNRVRLRLAVYKEKRQVFETTIELLNRGSITVGGPKHRKGYLLLNIFSLF